MKNFDENMQDHIKRLGRRALDVERQCKTVSKLPNGAIMLDILSAELDGLYQATTLVLNEFPKMDSDVLEGLSLNTIAALCELERAQYDWICLQLRKPNPLTKALLQSQEELCRHKLASLTAEHMLRRDKIACTTMAG